MQLEVAHRRYQGWRDALQKHGYWHDNKDVITCDSREQALLVAPTILTSDNRPDAIFCVNDDCASGVLYTAQKLGIRVPQELAICGFSDAPLCHITSPMLTTVGQQGTEIGKKALQRLLKRINGDEKRAQTEVIETKLITRGTTL
jgi:DNA-binding LacI/PurR family transcriptional regulator